MAPDKKTSGIRCSRLSATIDAFDA